MSHRHFAILVLVMIAGLLACTQPLIRPRLTPTPRPTRTPLPSAEASLLAAPSVRPPTTTPLPGWETLAPGLELRVMLMDVSGTDRPVEITLVRIDPAYFDFRVHYDLEHPATVSEWQARTGAMVLINGAFFEPGETVLGLLVADGQTYGHSFVGHGGMLSVRDGTVQVRSLAQFPYLPGEQFDQAIQGRPILLYPGGFPADFALSPEASRRTAVAQDRQGRIVLIVNDYGAVSLYRLRDWMAATDELELSVAFNLDGGGSTGLALTAGGRSVLIDSWWAVATALAVYPKPGVGR